MSVIEEPPRYRIYLLTIWDERSLDQEAPVVWRFRLEDSRTGRRRGFASLEALMAQLDLETAGGRNQARRAPGPAPANAARRMGAD